MELRKLYGHLGMAWDGYFWRTATAGFECDLVLATGGRLIPIEVKHAGTITDRSLSALDAFLDDNTKRATYGILLSMNSRVERLSRRVFKVPLGLILNGPDKN